jgi:hypothetical protein
MKIKFERRSSLRPLPLLDADGDSPVFGGGEPFVYGLPDMVLRKLRTVERAIDELHAYLARKAGEIREVEELIHGGGGFNHRQLAVLSDALRHPDRSYAFGAHAETNRVTHETARADLSALVDRGLLLRRRIGREYRFEPAPDLPARLRDLAA